MSPSQSPVWQRLRPCRGRVRKSGEGKKTEYYEWDYSEKHIEVYDHKGKHKGAIDPTTGKLIKEREPGRKLNH